MQIFKKIRFVFTFVALLLLAASPYAENMGIAAVVNDVVISEKDLNDRYQMILMDATGTPSADESKLIKKKILMQMITEALQLEEVKQFGIDASEAEINGHIASIETQNNLAPGALKEKFKKNNIPFEALKKQIRAGIAWAKFIMQMRSHVRVSKEDVKIQSAQHKKRDQTRYLLSEIVLPHSNRAAALQQMQLAQEITQQIQQGAPFHAVAMQTSAVPSASTGGDIGWIDEDQLPIAELETLQTMPVGSISAPIDTGDAIKIFLLRGKHLKEKSAERLDVRQVEIPLSLMLTELEKEAEISKFTTIFSTVKDCQSFVQTSDAIPNATLHFHQSIKPDQLTGGLDKIIKDLPENKLSSPLLTDRNTMMFFMVCRRHKATDDVLSKEAKDKLSESMEQQRLEALAAKRIQHAKRKAFIRQRYQ